MDLNSVGSALERPWTLEGSLLTQPSEAFRAEHRSKPSPDRAE